jgi:RNA polymerase sigma-70 factor (ECF subfamily)
MVDEAESDGKLVARARRGDFGAREALVRRFLRPAYAVALSLTRNVADAEDVAQESLVTAMVRLDQCRDPERFAGWLFQGVRNRALNQVEQRRVRREILEEVPQGEWVEASVPPVLLRRRLTRALEQLTQTQREVVLLHDLESWTHAEIASALEISEVMSRQHLFVARRAMRELLGDDAIGSPQGREARNGRPTN